MRKLVTTLRYPGLVFLLLLSTTVTPAQLNKALLDALPDSIRPVPSGKIKLTVDEETKIINHAGYYPLNSSLLADVDSLAAILNTDTLGLDDLKKFDIAQALSTFYAARGKQEDVIRESEKIARLLKDKKGYTLTRIKNLAFRAIALNRLAKYEESILQAYQLLEEARASGDSLGIGISFQALSFPQFALDLPERGLANLDSALSYYGKKARADKDFSGSYYTLFASKYLGNFSLYEKTGEAVYIDSMRSVYQFALANPISPSPLQKSFPVIEAYAAKAYKASIAASDSILADIGIQKDYTTTNLYRLVIVKKYKALSLYMLGKLPEAINEMKSCITYCQDLYQRDTTRNFVKTTIIKLSQLIVDYTKAQRNWSDAFYYLAINKDMQEKLALVENRGKVFETTQRYDFVQKEGELRQLESNNLLRKKERNMAIAATIASLLSLIAIALLFINRYRKLKLKKHLVEQEAKNQIEKLNLASQIQIDELEEKYRIAKKEEQKRLGRELHDNLSGTLATAKMKLESEAIKTMDNALHLQLKDIARHITAAYESTRNKSHEWYNQETEDSSHFAKRIYLMLDNALPDNLYKKEISIEENALRKVDLPAKINILRIIQEAITNILKHADANVVGLFLYEEIKDIVLKISDNGKGFQNEWKKGGNNIGLSSIHDRAKEMSGHLDINTSTNGTDLTINIPFTNNQSY